jgi:HEAT repeat protein
MRTLVLACLLLAAPAHAAPVAQLREDVDGDGAADPIELTSDGVVRIGGARRGDVKIAPAADKGRLLVGRTGAAIQIVADITRGAAREAVVLEARGAWREVTRFALGGVGLDGDEYSVEVEATPAGVYRYQSRWEVRRCDGKPARLFLERLDGAVFRPVAVPPVELPPSAAAIAAKPDAAAAPPLLYQAKSASHQAGARDAGGLALPRELDDGRADTAWREDIAASAGEGHFFTFQPRVEGARAQQLRIVPGDPTSAAAMRAVNRPRQLAIVSAAGAWRVELPDAAGEPLGAAYAIDLPQPIKGCVTVILESTYGRPQGATAIAELQVFAEGERAGGGEALLARVVAEDRPGAMAAAAELGKRGGAGATVIAAELAKTSDPGVRHRLVGALVKIQDPLAAAALVQVAASGWVRDRDLALVIGALARNGQTAALRDLAARPELAAEIRVAAAARLAPAGAGFDALVELAGTGPHALRREVIERLSGAPAPALLAAANAHATAAGAGDLWRALTRHARANPAARASTVAAMSAALPTAVDYERRYRLVDGIAAHGDAAALRSLDAVLRGLPAGAHAAALRQVAVRAIASAPRPEAAGMVVAFASDPDPGVRLAALSALAGAELDGPSPWHGPGDGPGVIDRVLANGLATDAWPEVRRRAAAALGTRCQRPDPARALADAVAKDRVLDVRIDALTALVQCKAAGARALLARTWDDGKAPIELRRQAVDLVAALGDPQLAASLVGKLARWRGEAITSAPALALAQSAAAAIGRTAPPGAAQALIAALDDSAFPEIVSAAALALGALGPACPPAAKTKLALLARSGDQAAFVAKRAAAQCGR